MTDIATVVTGEIGKNVILNKLMMLGHEVAEPRPDVGDDVWVDCRWRVQIKTPSVAKVIGGKGEPGSLCYFYHLQRKVPVSPSDVYVFYAADTDMSWVVPRSTLIACDVKQAVCIAQDVNRKRARQNGFSAAAWKCYEGWHLFKEIPGAM